MQQQCIDPVEYSRVGSFSTVAALCIVFPRTRNRDINLGLDQLMNPEEEEESRREGATLASPTLELARINILIDNIASLSSILLSIFSRHRENMDTELHELAATALDLALEFRTSAYPRITEVFIRPQWAVLKPHAPCYRSLGCSPNREG